MFRFFVFVMMGVSGNLFSQKLSGVVTDEEHNPIPAVLVMNMETMKKTFTNLKGEFLIDALPNNEFRFVREGYERNSRILKPQDFISPFFVSIIRTVKEIEEIEIKQKLSGVLEKDNKILGPPKNEVVLNSKIREYRRQKSDISIMKPKRNEFVQPVGPGFETTKIGYKWETFDFFLYLESSLGDDYFYGLGLTKLQVQPFVFFVLEDFEKSEILRFGYCSSADLARFMVHAEKKISMFRNKY